MVGQRMSHPRVSISEGAKRIRTSDPRYYHSSGPEMPSPRLQLSARLRTLSGPAPTNTQPFTVMRRRNTARQPAYQERDVYRADQPINGMTAYYAVTSWGWVIGPLTVDGRFFTDLEVVEHLEDVLDLVDPVKKSPTLTLSCADVAPAEARQRRPASPSAPPAESRLRLL